MTDMPDMPIVPDARTSYLRDLSGPRTIDRPTVESLAARCPHLTRDEIAALLASRQSTTIALPAVRVRGAFLDMTYHPARHGNGYRPFARIDWVRRTAASFAPDHQPGKPDGLGNTAYTDRAISFADVHWPDELITVDWTDTLTFVVKDPSQLDARSYPVTRYRITACLNRDWNELLNDRTAPRWSLTDEAITRLATSWVEGEELDVRHGWKNYTCAHCGGGLSTDFCHGCGLRFADNYASTGDPMPMPPKVIKALRDIGHVFALKPERLYV